MNLVPLILSYLRYVAISITLMFFGVLALGIVYELGISRVLYKPSKSLMLLARLPPDLAILIPAAVVDVKIEQMYLSELRARGVVEDNVVITYVLFRRPFTLITYLTRYYIPVVLVALGTSLGLWYLLLVLVPQIMSLLVAIAYGRFRIRGANVKRGCVVSVSSCSSLHEVFLKSLHSAIHALLRIVPRYIVATVLVVVVTVLNVATYLSNVVTPLLHMLGLSHYSIIAVCTGIISPVTAVFLIGEFVRSSFLSSREALLVLVLTRFLFIVLSDYPRHVIPLYLSFYPPKLVLKLITISLLISSTSLPIQLFLIYLLT